MGQTFESLIIDRKLPERSYLSFYFQKPDSTSDYFKVTLPFFENVSIKESKKARYQKYGLISRSSNLYSYTGADSRQLSLTFNMTLPHIISVIRDTSFERYQSYSRSEDLEEQKRLFRKGFISESVQSPVTTLISDHYNKKLINNNDVTNLILDPSFKLQDPFETQRTSLYLKHGVKELSKLQRIANNNKNRALQNMAEELSFGPFADERTLNQEFDNFVSAETQEKIIPADNAATQFKNKVVDLIVYWMNIIRSSTVNNSNNPLIGPPIIRVSHGVMYQDIPCICMDYNISYDELAGYDMNTLLPRIIKIDMKLEEVRTGDFGSGSNNYYITKDNLKGWESVISEPQQSMDPGYDYVLDELNKQNPKPVMSKDFGRSKEEYTVKQIGLGAPLWDNIQTGFSPLEQGPFLDKTLRRPTLN